MKKSLKLLILLGCFTLLGLLVLLTGPWLRSTETAPAPDQATLPLQSTDQSTQDGTTGQPALELTQPDTTSSQAPPTVLRADASVFERFNEWAARYVAATEEQRRGLLDEGIEIARMRRVELRSLIETDPRQAIEKAVPPVLRQQLPAALAELLEERVNEKGFYGVLGAVPSAENPKTPPYRREVRTSDGGYYSAFVYGRRLSQHTTENASIVGIAVDDMMAIDERPLRVVASGEIPNHPNNLTRRRTVSLLDEQGFTGGRETVTAPAPPRDVVETCPVSGQVVEASQPENAVTANDIVAEASGQFHYLCRGGHIVEFEEKLLSREGGNGGPLLPTSPPTATQSTGYKTNLLMRVAFPEALKGSVTEKDGHDLGKNVQDWFLNSSYGSMTFMTTVTPLLVLPRSEAWYKDQDTSGSAYEVLTDARAAAKAAGFDPANFNFDTVIFTGTPGSFGGQAYVGGKGCWLKSGTGTGVAAHEYGHNFGLMHANFWSTTNGSAIGGGSHVEYGDSFDTMGSASAGDYQFNACHKNILNWIPTSLVHDVTTSGTYRIYQMDQPAQNPRLRYAIKTRKDADRDYWVDLRQLFTTNAWVQGGVFLHWSPWATSASGSHLLDTTPGSIDGKTDAPIVIGRTFSDPETGIHITPIAKNATTPPSADVVVNLGMFPGNTAPVVAVGASATSVATSVAVNITATASDLDGDVLSYAWDFGDKSFSTTNSPAVSKSWTTAGEYRVRCTVSDMKGKTASASVIITVGSPTTFRISGTITANGQPLANVRVHNSLTGASYREAYTDTNGTYTLVRLSAGTYNIGTELYGVTLTPTGSASVTVGPSASGVNFTAADQPQVSIALQDADCAEGANTGTFRISRTGSTAAALTVLISTPQGSAAKNTDYTQLPAFSYVNPFDTLAIPAGQSYVDVIVTANDDTGVESYESYILTLVPSTTYVIGNAAATLWIADADTANPLVSLRVTDRDTDESGDGAQFAIERLGAITAALNVSVALSGTATNGTDYASIPTTITIPAGASSVPVNITPIQDTSVETMETVILTINTNAAYTRPATSADYAGTVNLHDDDQPILTVAATDSTAAEAGNDPGIFTITRTGSTAAALTVNYGLTGSALHGTDYVPLPGVLTIPAGSAVATVVITPIDDAIGEPAQTAVFQLRGGIGYTVGAASNATVTITDDSDPPYASIAVTTGPAIEGGTAGVFRVTTTGTGSGNISVLYSVTGTAANGIDFTTLSGSVSMARNATSNLTITTLQDLLAEGYETITVTLTPDPAYSLALDSSATMNLQDDDAPQVNVSTTDDTFTETNGSLAKFFVSRTGATTNALTVNYTLGGTATAGADYTAPSGSVTIAAGATGAFLNVSLLDDALAEGTETIVLNVTPGSGYAIGNGSATRYITDAESASATTQVRFSASTSSAVENAGTVNIPVTLSAASASAVTVEYFINGGTALGAGIDYGLTPGVLTFLAGETSKDIQVAISDDTLDESNATVVIALANPNNARLGTSSHTLTITDNDAPPGVSVGFAGTTGSGLESQSPAPLTVALSTAQPGSVTVDYAVTGGTATGGGTDYTITTGTLTFAAGETVKVIPNTIIDDASVDSGETIILTLSNPVGAVLSANPVLTYTITDDDAATVTIVATDAGAAEPGSDTGLFTVTRTGSTTAALTVNFSVSGTATSGSDYANLANTVVIAAGVSNATVPVTSLNDAVIESAETVILTLTPGVYTIGAQSSATVTIADDDVDMIVTIVASDANAVESGDPGAFTVTRAGSTTDSLTVNLGITGTATAGSDYTALATSVVIPAAATSVVIPVSPLMDALNEGDETVILTALAGSGYSRGAPVSATVTIANTDDGSPPTLAPSSIVDNKGGGPVFINTLVTYTVTFSKDMDASTVTAADFGNAGSAPVTIGSVTETTPTSGIFTVQATPTNAGTLQLRINAAADLKSAAGTSLDTTSAIADNTIITAAGYAPTLADALDTTELTWTSSGNANWIYQTTTTHDGADAAKSGSIGDSQNSYMETTVTGPGTMTFWWKVSSENGYDYLRFYLDGAEQTGSLARISGTVDWTQKTVSIPSGIHTVKWGYTKDVDTVSGSDAAWVDQVVYTPSAAPEIAVEQPVGTELVDGGASINCGSFNLSESSAAITFTVKNTGDADLTGLSLTKDGTHGADYTLGALGAGTLAPGASTTFDVTFSPGDVGIRTAAIHLASNDANENPFDISLTGTGIGPGTLAVTPAGNLTSSGNYGGPFSPSSLIYTLSNPGNTPIDWTAEKTAPWVNLSEASGTLAAGDNTTVTASINDNANILAVAGYIDTVTFSNTTNGNGNTTRGVSLNVTPAPATVTLGNLSQTYDGSLKSVSVTTNPPDLDYSVTYTGNTNPPTNAGTYAVVATVTEPNYTGGASESLVIAKASQTINFGALSPVLDDAGSIAPGATATSGLSVSYASSNSLVATISGSTVNIVGLGTTTITASQAGDTNYNAATSVPQTLTVVRSNPLAVTGGPYSVLVGQSVTLNGGASEPSFNETITTYEWDLNNDNTFADVTGATPAAISYSTLTATWGRAPGPNTIQLKVTDSSGKTSITSTILTLIATLNWDSNTVTNGAQDGAGAWLSANQWWTGSANTTWSSSANAIFGNGGAGGAVTLASPTTANSITFSSFTGTYTLGTTGQALTISGGITNNSAAGAVSIISPVALAGGQAWSNNSSGAITVSCAISGTGGLTKSGTGTVILNPSPDSSDYSGTTIISNGVLNIQKASALGSVSDGTSVSSGAALQIQGGITTVAEPLTLDGGGVAGNGALRNISGNNNYGGLVTLAGTTRIHSDSGTLTLGNTGTITGAGLALTFSGAGSVTVNSIIGTTTGTVTKEGAGTLTLAGANTFSGGTNLNAGTLSTTSDGNFGSGGGLTVNGTAIWNAGAGSTVTYNRSLTVNEGIVLSLASGNALKTVTGVLSGNGSMVNTSTTTFEFNNTGNTFTGTVNNGYEIRFNSLGDSSNPINLVGSNSLFTWQGGAKTFALRPFTIQAIGTGNINNNGTGALTVQQNLAITGAAGARTISLGGTNTGTNTFVGNIADGTGSVVSLTKAGIGTWALAGTNTYSGLTTMAQTNPIGAGLTFQGIQALSPNTDFTQTHGGGTGGHGPFRVLDDSATPASRSGVDLTFNHSNNSMNAMSLFVGNNSIANGGTSSSTQTDSTIQLGNMNFNQGATGQTAGTQLSVTGANGYKLQIGNVKISLQTAFANAWPAKLNATNAPLIVGGNVQQLAGSGGTTTLQLDGTVTGSQISGNILNSADAAPKVLNLAKLGTGSWILTGANTYSGATTISGGTLQLGDGSSGKDGTIENTTGITNNATLVFSRFGDISSGVAISGTGAVTKTGPGTQTLSGTNSYTGATAVDAGKLFINGNQTSATGAISLSANATLGGTGIIGGNTTIAANGRLEFNLSTNAANHDRLELAASRTLAFSGASVLTITSSGGASPGTYTLITGGNNITGSAPTLVNLPVGWTASVSISGNSLLLNVTSTDNIPPALTGITDNQSGGPVDVNTLVTYTVTFSEDMDHTTVTAADFGNAGTSSFTIGTVSETSPGVFTIQVTPTTPGSLQLRVNAGAVITDIVGNPLNTNAAITDMTVITVNPLMTTVPDVVGLAQAAAESNIAAANLVVGTVSTQNHLTIPAGGVISQNPTGGASVVQNSAVDLVVSLGPPTYTVSYNANNATSGTSPTNQTKTYDVDLTLAINSGGLLRTGYMFAGWNTAADGTGVDYAAGGTYTANTPQILHAKWTLNTVAAVTNTSSLSVAEGGSDTFQVKLSAEPVAGVAITVSRTSGDPDITVQSGSSLTFTSADWNTYQTVTLAAAEDNGDNTAGTATITCSGGDITPAILTASEIDDDHVLSAAASNGSITKNPDTSYYDRDSTVQLTATPDTGYHFTGWSGDASGSDNPLTVIMSADKSVTANFTANALTLTINSVGISEAAGSAATTATVTRNSGTTGALTVSLSSSDPTEATVPTAVEIPDGQTSAIFSIDAINDEIVDGPQTVVITATATGHADANDSIDVTDDDNLTHTASFDANGGSTASPTSKLVTYDTAYGELATSTRTGYTFNGWFTAATGGTLVTAATTVSTTADHTLHAQWTANTYAVSYSANIATSGTAPAEQTKTHDISLTLATNSGNLARTDYIFSGWNTAADGSGTDFAPGGTYTDNAAVTLYAKWTPKATPTVTTWPTAATIQLGQTLSSATLSGGSASVAGSFSYNNPSVTPMAGIYIAVVTFTPTDTTSYLTVEGTVNVTVLTAFEAWAGAGAPFNGDSNKDGVADGLAWLLGANDKDESALDKMPVASRNGPNLRLIFRCLKSAKRGGAQLKVQSSANLGVTDPWTSHEAAVPDEDGTSNGVVFDTTEDGDFINVIADIPAAGTQLFGRLNATSAP